MSQLFSLTLIFPACPVLLFSLPLSRARAATLNKIGRSLVRIMRNYREIQFIVLSNMVEFAHLAPDMFRKYIKDFFIAVSAACACAARVGYFLR